MIITVTGETDEERAILDSEWGALDEDGRDGIVPKPSVTKNVADFSMTGTRIINKAIPTPFSQTHLNPHLGTANLIGQLYASIEIIRQTQNGKTSV